MISSVQLERNRTKVRRTIRAMLAPPPAQTPTDWCLEFVTIPAPQTDRPGPFSLAGYEFCRELIDDFGDPTVRDSVACFGSQVSKSNSLMMGIAWATANDPSTLLWVLPNKDLARGFAEERWIPIVEHTPQLAALLPKLRHRFKKTQQQLGGSVLVFVGSNSPANLSSRPSRRVILDEVDKFDPGGGGEADALNLAEQRTKNFARPQRFKTSTPTMVTGIIWQEFLKGDQRRYFIPCPHCRADVVLAWSSNYNVFTKTGKEAFVKWSPEAKRAAAVQASSRWDLDLVRSSAHYACPHCQNKILEGEKRAAIPRGRWIATAAGSAGFRSRHLPSLYSCAPENSVGNLAVKFLQASNSLMGLQGFINGDLAEPYQNQETMGERVEIISRGMPTENAATHKLMCVDCQMTSYYYVVRSWSAEESVGIEAGQVETADQLREIQTKHGIPDVGVFIDSGFGARSDAEVYTTCARYGQWVDGAGRRFAVGWTPTKGMPGRKRWRHPETKQSLPWLLTKIDPFAGSSAAGSCYMHLFEFSGDFFKDVLQLLRTGKRVPKWSVLDTMATDAYWHHLDAEVKTAKERLGGFIEHVWMPRSKRWPNHWLDCEVLQLAQACFFGFLSIEHLMGKGKSDG